MERVPDVATATRLCNDSHTRLREQSETPPLNTCGPPVPVPPVSVQGTSSAAPSWGDFCRTQLSLVVYHAWQFSELAGRQPPGGPVHNARMAQAGAALHSLQSPRLPLAVLHMA